MGKKLRLLVISRKELKLLTEDLVKGTKMACGILVEGEEGGGSLELASELVMVYHGRRPETGRLGDGGCVVSRGRLALLNRSIALFGVVSQRRRISYSESL